MFESLRNGLRAFAIFAFGLLVPLAMPARGVAQGPLPRFEPTECPFERGDWANDTRFECEWLVVPEDRGNPKTRAIKLAVVLVRARQPGSFPPLVMLHGGPGDSGIRIFTRRVVETKLNEHRDIVIYDQRGAGFSEPKLCPEFKDTDRESQKLKTQKEEEEFERVTARKCIASLDTHIQRAAYNTSSSAADMIDLRKLLTYSVWDVYGVSYGARLAQEAMRRDPKGIRSVVLDKPATRGPTREGEVGLSTQRAFERVFADCSEQPECHTAFPTLEKDFYEIYDDLNKTPLIVQVEQNPNNEFVVLDGQRFLSRIRNDIIKTGRPERLGRLPLLLNEFRRGDRSRAARILVGYNPQAVVGSDSTLISLVTCYDIYGKELIAKRKAINAQVRPPFRRDLMDECKLWQRSFANPSEWQPIRSSIPTLIFTGRYDDRTPTEHARRIASKLTRAYVYEIPNEGHDPRPAGCRIPMLLQFLADPFKEPDASCIKTIASTQFLTRWQ